MSQKKIFFLFYNLLLFLIPVWSWAFPEKYHEIIEKNPFSASRKYIPPPTMKAGPSSSSLKQEEIKKYLILRGTMYLNGRSFAILEIGPFLQKRFELNKKRIVLPLGGRLGGCTLEEIKRGEVILGGDCGGIKLSLAEDPERAQPLPKSSIAAPLKTTHPPQVLTPKSKVPKKGLSFEKKKKQPSQGFYPPSERAPSNLVNPFLKLLKSKKHLKPRLMENIPRGQAQVSSP